MSEKKIVVPGGMHRAAVEWLLLYENFKIDTLEPSTSTPEQQANGRASVVLEAALRWLYEELGKSEGISPMLNGTYQDGWNGAWRHIRRLFVRTVPDSEIPKEIEDLLLVDAATFKLPDGDNFCGSAADRNAAVIEAYHRGQRSKQQID